MSQRPPHNGIEVRGLTILCIPDGAMSEFMMWLGRGLSSAAWPGPGGGPTLLRVIDDATERTLASRRFPRRSQAKEARLILVAAVEQMDSDEFASTDWQVLADVI